MTTLIENLRRISAIVLPDASLSRAVDEAIAAVAQRDLIESERTRLAIKCDAAFDEIKRLGNALSTARLERDAARGAVTVEVTTARHERDEARRERDEQRARVEFHLSATEALIAANAKLREDLAEVRKARDDWRVGFDAAQADYVKASGEREQARKDRDAAKVERDATRRQRDDLLATRGNLQTELKRAREGDSRTVIHDSGTVSHVPAPPSPLNLVERVLRLEREVLFVRQRPANLSRHCMHGRLRGVDNYPHCARARRP